MEEDIFSVDADLTALKELEETLKENPDKEWLEYDGRKWIKEDYVVLKSKVKDKIEELEEYVKDFEEYWSKDTRKFKKEKCIDYYKLEALQDLLERSREDG